MWQTEEWEGYFVKQMSYAGERASERKTNSGSEGGSLEIARIGGAKKHKNNETNEGELAYTWLSVKSK